MTSTTYKQASTSFDNLGKSSADVAEAIAKLIEQMTRKTYNGAFDGAPKKIELIFPKVTPAQKNDAFEWKLYVERQPLTPYVKVQR